MKKAALSDHHPLNVVTNEILYKIVSYDQIENIKTRGQLFKNGLAFSCANRQLKKMSTHCR